MQSFDLGTSIDQKRGWPLSLVSTSLGLVHCLVLLCFLVCCHRGLARNKKLKLPKRVPSKKTSPYWFCSFFRDPQIIFPYQKEGRVASRNRRSRIKMFEVREKPSPKTHTGTNGGHFCWGAQAQPALRSPQAPRPKMWMSP